MPGNNLFLASVAPDPVGSQIHMGAMIREALIMNSTVIEVHVRAADPTTIGEQT